MDLADLMTITDAVAQLGISRQAVHDAITRGELNALEMAGRRLLSRSEVAAYQPRAYRERPGSKPKGRTKKEPEAV